MKKVLDIALVSVLFLSLTGCDEFLNRPTIDNYSVGTYYKNDDQCLKGVNYLYGSPWYDFQRGFTNVGETMSGNMANSGSAYVTLTISPDHEELTNMSKSLWSVICHCSTVADNIYNADGPSTAIKRQTIGETMVWKAMAYFYLVRYYGEVPIIHNNSEKMNEGGYNVMPRNTKENVFEYVLMTLENAEKLLPKNAVNNGRIDYWSARALEAKVYLAYADLKGENKRPNADLLKKAAEISKDVIENSGRALLPNFSDNFRLQHNINQESLIAWQWNGNVTQWTCQNSFQCDNAMQNVGEMGDNWGHWRGASVDLQEAFGIPATMSPEERKTKDVDARRKATYMLPGDIYEYFWTDLGGFDPLRNCYDADYARYGMNGTWGGGAGSHLVKHLFGNNYDHMQALGYAPSRNMASGLATHLLRLSDVMLINAEANAFDGGNKDDGAKYLNKVRARSIKGYQNVTDYTFEDVWKERRKELAFEGDRWLDFVRVSWYNPEFAVDELKNQRRAEWYGFEGCYKYYFENGVWDLNAGGDPDTNDKGETMPKFRYPTPGFDNGVSHPEAYQNGVTAATFKLQLPPDDIIFNEHLNADKYPAENVDPRTAFNYDKYINL